METLIRQGSGGGSDTTAPLELDNTNSTDTIISGKLTADGDVRWFIDADGKITWEDGAGSELAGLTPVSSGLDFGVSGGGTLDILASSALAVGGDRALWAAGGTMRLSDQASVVLQVLPDKGTQFTGFTASTVGTTIKGAASQTANLTEWQDSSGTVLASVGPAGRMLVEDGSASAPGVAFTNDTDTGFLRSATDRMKANCGGTQIVDYQKGAGVARIGFLGASAAPQRAHVADPSGGATVDAEARTAIDSILTTLETFGFHATS